MAELTGPHTEQATRLAQFNHEVQRIAFLMCEEFGLDPEDVVNAPREDSLTPDEFRKTWGASEMIAYRPQTVPMQQWESFRRQAAIALASFRAVNKYILTEA
jgi:hypothetical protein